MAEITPSTPDENPGTNTAIHTGSEKSFQMLNKVGGGRRRGFNFELTFWCVCVCVCVYACACACMCLCEDCSLR